MILEEVIFMNIVIAIDSFKGSLSSVGAGKITAAAIQDIVPSAHTQVFPLADGGEGTVDALTAGLGGHIVHTEVTGPLGKKIPSRYGIIEASCTAVIEMADAAGITLVPPAERNPLHTTTYGLGELILQAADNGCRNFIIGIGGSATNDCGIGMLTALGLRFLKADGTPAGIFGNALTDIETIDASTLHPIIKDCSFRVACDVVNPLYGENGCAAVFGPQKGATPEIVKNMDAAIHAFADKVNTQLGIGNALEAGTGAAGGLGYAFRTFLPATLEAGITLVLDAIHIEDALRKADIVITGEGGMDFQTAMGKAPVGVAKLARKANSQVRVLAFCGCASPEAEAVNDNGIDAYFPILHQVTTLAQAMEPETAERNLRQTVHQVFRLLR
jgi:glycerate 2-kinase